MKVDEMSETEMLELIAGIKENPGKQNFSLRLVDQKNKLACSLKPMQGRINAQQVLRDERHRLAHQQPDLVAGGGTDDDGLQGQDGVPSHNLVPGLDLGVEPVGDSDVCRVHNAVLQGGAEGPGGGEHFVL